MSSNGYLSGEFSEVQGVAVTVQESLMPSTHILLNFRTRMLGNKASVDKSQVTVDADKAQLSVSKKLLDCKEYEAIESFITSTQKWLLTRALPANKTFKHGFYRVPLGLLADIDYALQGSKAQWESLVTDFIAVYEQAQAKASGPKEEGGLGSLFRYSDYPPLDRVKGAFAFTWQYLSFSTPDSLPPQIAARERETMRQSLQAALEECRTALRTGFVSLIDRAVDRLRSDKEGKAMRYTFTLTDQMTDFLDFFSARNSLAQDESLEILVNKARKIMSECPDLGTLKDNPELRVKIQAQFAEVKQAIEQADIMPQSIRTISLEDN